MRSCSFIGSRFFMRRGGPWPRRGLHLFALLPWIACANGGSAPFRPFDMGAYGGDAGLEANVARAETADAGEPVSPPPGEGAVADAAAVADRPAAPHDAAAPEAGAVGSVKVFIDTDLVWDPGDVAALTLAHGLADRCEIEIIGVTCVTTASSAAPAAEAINGYFGRPDVPVGVLKGSGFLVRDGFSKAIADRFAHPRYKTSADAPDATKLFREVLTRQADASVVVVSIGPLRNIANFLKSPPDDLSPLDGKALVAKKVKFLSAMAGVFADIGAFGGPVKSEWNVEQDVAAAKYVVDNWPVPIMFSGFEIGWYTCPDASTIRTADPTGPMGVALKGADGVPCGAGNGRPGWDQTSLLYAARGLGTFWTGEMKGTVDVDLASKGNRWRATPDRGQGFLVNKGISTRDDERTNQGKLKGTLTAAMAEIEAQSGLAGRCRAKR